MDGLIVLEPHASMIINGEKTWELRSREPPTKNFEKELHLLSKGESLGIIKITDMLGPFSKIELQKKIRYHKFDVSKISHNFNAYAWEVEVCKKFTNRKKYVHPIGARVWVNDVVLQKNVSKQKISSYF